MNKAELIDAIAAATGQTKAATTETINAFRDVLKEAATRGDAVSISGMFNMSVVQTTARPGRNPKTGEATVIPARKRVKFKAAGVINDAANS